MKLNVSFQNTVPFSEPRLDCYQNCVATLLRAQGENIVYLGACWPWEFVVHAKSDTAHSLNDYVLRNTKCVKADVLKRFYGIYLRRSHAKGEALLRELREGTRMKTPLIVNVDEFYMPYHFQHVYGKQHGVHTVLLFHMDSNKGLCQCISTIPMYKGDLPLESLKQGLEHNNSGWSYEVIERYEPHQICIPEPEAVSHTFAQILRQVYKGMVTPYHFNKSGRNFLHTRQLNLFLKELRNIESKSVAQQRTEWFCQGDWGWNVDRKSQWLMNYLSYENKRIGLRHYERIMELIPEIDRTWRLAFRQLFKDYQLKGKGDCLYEVCNRLSWVEKTELDIISMLLADIKEGNESYE